MMDAMNEALKRKKEKAFTIKIVVGDEGIAVEPVAAPAETMAMESDEDETDLAPDAAEAKPAMASEEPELEEEDRLGRAARPFEKARMMMEKKMKGAKA